MRDKNKLFCIACLYTSKVYIIFTKISLLVKEARREHEQLTSICYYLLQVSSVHKEV